MKKEHLILIGVGIAGIILYKQWNDKKKAEAAANAAAASNGETTSNAIGSPTGGSCAKQYSHEQCAQACSDHFNGEYNSSDRKCYRNGRAVTGGVFGSNQIRTRSVSM